MSEKNEMTTQGIMTLICTPFWTYTILRQLGKFMKILQKPMAHDGETLNNKT